MSHPKTVSNRSVRSPLAAAAAGNGGRAFEDTLIGTLLSKSCLPLLPGKPYLFFEKPKVMSERDVELTAGTMWQVKLNLMDSELILLLFICSQCEHIKNIYLKCFWHLSKVLKHVMMYYNGWVIV